MADAPQLRVGFVLPAELWIGGRNYLRNLLAAIDSLPGKPIVPVLFAGRQTDVGAADFPSVEIVRTALLDRKSLAWLLRKLLTQAAGQDLLMTRLLKRHGIAVLSHSIDLGRQDAVATLGWIADFQHLHMPELFSQGELQKRYRDYMALCQCDTVIVSSEAAGADLRTFSPESAHKAALLRFVASPASLTLAAGLPELQQTYHFAGPYFLLPNQFWKHKNHRVVLDALKLLKLRNRPLLVLATGTTEDFRNPTFFPALMEHASQCDVLDCFRVLGQIPFGHLVGLMQHATAFINPSTFEGWSTSVEEAKSMGKQIVLSDIAVHREQAPERAFYFPADDPAALADALEAASAGFDAERDQVMQQAAREHFPQRQRQFGETYLEIVREALRK